MLTPFIKINKKHLAAVLKQVLLFSIQTLKHTYEDLRHHDVQCPNEPEFRLYDVLLKLNDGDTLQVTILGF